MDGEGSGKEEKPGLKVISSKWETVDESELEAQGNSLRSIPPAFSFVSLTVQQGTIPYIDSLCIIDIRG